MANSMAVIPDNEIIVEGGGLVPSTQGASSGDVLTVGQNGPEWAAPGGGGGGVPDVADPLYIDTDDAVALRYGSGLYLEEGEATENDTLAVALSGTGGLYYDTMEDNGLAVQVDPAGGLENFIDDGVQVGLRAKVDGTSIDINADGELEALGGATQLLTPAQTASLIDTSSLPNIIGWADGGSTPIASFSRGNGLRRLFIGMFLKSAELFGEIDYTITLAMHSANAGDTEVQTLNTPYEATRMLLTNGVYVYICKEIPLYIPETIPDGGGDPTSVDHVNITGIGITFDTTSGGTAPTTLLDSSLSVWVI